MSIEDYKQMCFTGKYPSPAPVAVPVIPSKVAPTPDDKMAHVSSPKPLEPSDYNNLSCSDMEYLHQFRCTDMLHRPDKMAKDFNKGSFLNRALNHLGVDKFKSHYFKFSKQ